MEISYFKYLGLVFGAFFVTYMVGHIFYSLFSEEGESDISAEFKKNIFGLWIIVVVYSIVKTMFFTMNFGFVILFLAAIILNKVKIKIRSLPFNYPVLIFQSVTLILIYSYLYFRLYNPFTKEFYYLEGDFSLYATHIYRMNLLNAETISTDFFYKEPIISLYHYTELWYGAFLTWLFKINALRCFYLLVWTYGLSVFSLGVLAVLSLFKKDKKFSNWEYILAISALVISPVYFYLPKSVPFFDTDWGIASLFVMPKYCFYGHSLLLATVYLLKNKYNKFIIVFLSGIFITPLGIPSILIASTVFTGVLIYIKKVDIRQAHKFIIPIFLSGIFLIIYSRLLLHHNSKYPHYTVTYPILKMLSSLQYYRLVFNIFAGLTIKFFISAIPLILLIILFRKQFVLSGTEKLTLLFLVLFSFSTMFSFSLFYFLVDGIQIWVIFYQSIISLLTTIAFLLLLYYNRRIFLVLFPLYFLICVFQNIINNNKYTKADSAFLLKIKLKALNDPKINFGIFSKSASPLTLVYGQNYNAYVPIDNIRLYFDNYQPIYLNSFEVLLSQDNLIRQYQLMFLENSTLYKFVQRQKKESRFVSIERSRIDLIKQANIRYIIKLHENKLPVSIDTLVKERIFNNDSSYEFLILK
ncbi:MAG: hypothetical protein JWN78_598 [Bacteroidota bacterium]|nr:hypothetical protein [Bacteroidota bacterium]